MRYKEQIIRIQVKMIFESLTSRLVRKTVIRAVASAWLISGRRVINFG
jgi:hypothetical protein